MALLVKVDGTTEEVQVPRDDTSLKYLQSAVGGNIEYVPVINPEVVKLGYSVLFCDEEGKLKGKCINFLATTLAGRDGNQELNICDPLCGDVLFVAEGEVD